MRETNTISTGRSKRLAKKIEVLTLKDCSGERFPKNKNKILGYRNPVKFYGKKNKKT
jgi:hypothetical protein